MFFVFTVVSAVRLCGACSTTDEPHLRLGHSRCVHWDPARHDRWRCTPPNASLRLERGTRRHSRQTRNHSAVADPSPLRCERRSQSLRFEPSSIPMAETPPRASQATVPTPMPSKYRATPMMPTTPVARHRTDIPRSATEVAVAPTPDPVGIAVARVKRWFTEGNVPVKVGVLVLFLGVAALLKYAADAGLADACRSNCVSPAIAILAALRGACASRGASAKRHIARSRSACKAAPSAFSMLTVYAAFRYLSRCCRPRPRVRAARSSSSPAPAFSRLRRNRPRSPSSPSLRVFWRRSSPRPVEGDHVDPVRLLRRCSTR